jgi:hypothetical protein
MLITYVSSGSCDPPVVFGSGAGPSVVRGTGGTAGTAEGAWAGGESFSDMEQTKSAMEWGGEDSMC